MAFGKLFWKLFFGNVALLAVVLATCLWLIGREVDQQQDRDMVVRLTSQAQVLRELLKDDFDPARGPDLDRFMKNIGQAEANGLRITLILADGRVLADSEGNPATMESHAHRPEVEQALASGKGEASRLSQTVGRPMRYAAVAVGGRVPGQDPIGVVRVARPVRSIAAEAGSRWRLIWGIGLLMLAAAVLLALGLARLWSQPIRRITQAAQNLSRGYLTGRIVAGGSDELATLARALNEMRGHLADQLDTIDLQKRTLESLLAQLHEGVIVAGPNGRIFLLNPAASRMLDLRHEVPDVLAGLPGPSVEECIQEHELQQLLLTDSASFNAAEKHDGDIIREVRLRAPEGGSDITLLARAADIVLPAFGRGSGPIGAGSPTVRGRLLVLSDVTPLTRLLQMKADFAANASHELRTPLAAIRAALETLLHIDLAREADSARHFVSVIDRHGKRLEMLVADLLELSRLESPRARFEPHEVRLRELLSALHDQHEHELTGKQLHWEVDLPPGLNRITASEHLLRIVLENLVDNAIKFTDAGGRIRIIGREETADAGKTRRVALTVADDGCGIALEEQDRVFERFYQVERARSGGAIRGTGLGLSIVRHAVAAMKASIDLDSAPAKGTRVTIRIPQASRAATDALVGSAQAPGASP